MDVLFKEKVDTSNIKEYFKISTRNRRKRREEREAQFGKILKVKMSSYQH